MTETLTFDPGSLISIGHIVISNHLAKTASKWIHPFDWNLVHWQTHRQTLKLQLKYYLSTISWRCENNFIDIQFMLFCYHFFQISKVIFVYNKPVALSLSKMIHLMSIYDTHTLSDMVPTNKPACSLLKCNATFNTVPKL